MAIKTVAVVGASGNVGVEVVKALLAANFTVTAVARPSSSATFPAGVEVRKADAADVDSLVKAFQGQDAVVSTVATDAVVVPAIQNNLIDAVVAAGVKRYIPSEFGVNTRTVEGVLNTMLQGKIKALDRVIEKANSNPGFTWTGIATGMFFDWGLAQGMLGIDLKKKAATILDSGNEPTQSSSLPFIGKAVASVLQHEAETANKYLVIQEFSLSQNGLLGAVEGATGAKFAVTNVKADDLEKRGHEKLAAGDFSSFVDFLWLTNWKDGHGNAVKEGASANKLLGLPTGDLGAAVKGHLKNASS